MDVNYSAETLATVIVPQNEAERRFMLYVIKTLMRGGTLGAKPHDQEGAELTFEPRDHHEDNG